MYLILFNVFNINILIRIWINVNIFKKLIYYKSYTINIQIFLRSFIYFTSFFSVSQFLLIRNHD